MAQFPKNPQRLTPYPNFRFKLKWDNVYVAGISKVGGLSRRTEVIRHREGGDPSTIHLAPGETEYGPITLERGVSYDPAFEQWCSKVFDAFVIETMTLQNEGWDRYDSVDEQAESGFTIPSAPSS